jgi:alkylhydroperoxidase family enzyme
MAPRIHGQVPDDIWGEAAARFDEDQLAALVLAIGVINLWNRIAVTTQMVAGSWRQPGTVPTR